MQDRTIQCLHYICEGKCALGKKECHFWKEMQKCPTYKKKPRTLPARVDNRRKKLEKLKNKERGDYYA